MKSDRSFIALVLGSFLMFSLSAEAEHDLEQELRTPPATNGAHLDSKEISHGSLLEFEKERSPLLLDKAHGDMRLSSNYDPRRESRCKSPLSNLRSSDVPSGLDPAHHLF